MGTLHDDLGTFIIMSHSIILNMRHVSDNICRENTHLMFNNFFPPKIVLFIIWNNMVQPDRPQMTI